MLVQRIIKRFSVVTLTLVLTPLVVLLSFGIYLAVALPLGVFRPMGVFGSLFIPAILVPLVCAGMLHLTRSLYRAQDELLKAQEELERKVADRTEELSRANEQLRGEVQERKQAEGKLRESEEKYRTIFENSVECIYRTTPEGRYINANLATARVLGYESPEELMNSVTDVGTQIYAYPEDRRKVLGFLETQGFIDNLEAQFRCKDGTIIWGLHSCRLVRDDEGNVLYIEGATKDITKRRQAEEALRDSEERFHILFESAGDAIVILNKDSLIDCNGKALTMFGCTRERFIGETASSFMPQSQPDGRDSKEEMAAKTGECMGGTPQFFEWRFARLDETVFDAEVSLTRIDIRGETYLQAIVRDVTDRKHTEEALRRLSLAIEQAAEEVVITDPEGVIQYVNPAFEKITGYSRDEAIGQTPRIVGSGIHDHTFYAGLWDTIKSGGTWTGQITNRRKDGALIEEDITISPLISSSGQPTGYVSLRRDITEEVKLHSQLRQAQKMEAIGTLAGGIAHDFNNILTVITGFGSLLQMAMKESDPLRRHVDQILSSSEKAAGLTQSLLAFSRRQPVTLAPLDINTTIKGTEKLLKRLLTEDIELRTTLTEDDTIVMADKTQMDQILFNLVSNARDAMPRGGKLSIETDRVGIDSGFRRVHGFGEPGWYVQIKVGDTGMGMDETTRDNIFDPFFTTKDVGKGTGLGLATVYGIVKQHGGYITVDSAPGQGAIFRIYLPAVKAIVGHEEERTISVSGGNETILIAEDNEGVRHFMRDVLEQYGYKTVLAMDGEEAIERFMQHTEDIDLIIVDSVMPKKNGREVYEGIRALKSNIKALFTSGYTKDIILDKGIEHKDFAFIAKPLSPATFLQKVREVLDR